MLRKLVTIFVIFILTVPAIADEKVWYCVSEMAGSLLDENASGNWELVHLKQQRITVKHIDWQNRVTIVNSAVPVIPTEFYNCEENKGVRELTDQKVIYCAAPFEHFALNTNTGYASYSSTMGRVAELGGDFFFQMSLIAYKCEKF